jgi:hypothetical protein
LVLLGKVVTEFSSATKSVSKLLGHQCWETVRLFCISVGTYLWKLTSYVCYLYHAFVFLFCVGVIFALKVLTSRETPPGRENVHGMWVPTRYAAWIELILIHLLVPNASFMGHLAGILAGVIYTSTPVGTVVDEFISSLTGIYALLMNVCEQAR